MKEENNPRTLYVGNLDASVDKEQLCSFFSEMGPIKECKIIREPDSDAFALVEFNSTECAATALAALDKKVFADKELEIDWATGPGIHAKLVASKHHHIFIGDLPPEVGAQTLNEEENDEVRSFLRIGDRTIPIEYSHTPVLIGCGRYCNVRIASCKLSKAHATIMQAESKFIVVDLSSRHKTFVDGIELKPFMPHVLRKDSTLRFGDLEATLIVDPKSVPPIAPSRKPEHIDDDDQDLSTGIEVIHQFQNGNPSSIGPNANQQKRFLRIGDINIPIGDTLMTIGWAHSCSVRIAGCKLSKVHAWIEPTKWGLVVLDMWTQQKTFINGMKLEPLKPYLLTKDSTLRFGDLEATLTMDPDFVAGQSSCPPKTAAHVSKLNGAWVYLMNLIDCKGRKIIESFCENLTRV